MRFIEVSAVDDYVVEVHEAAFPRQARQRQLHKTFKSRGRVAEAEWHCTQLKETLSRDEGRLFFVHFVHLNLLVTRIQIERREIHGAFECVQRVVDAR